MRVIGAAGDVWAGFGASSPACRLKASAGRRAATGSPRLSVAPRTDPPPWLFLVLIESLRSPMSLAAEAFLEVLLEESARVNRVWLDVVAETAR